MQPYVGASFEDAAPSNNGRLSAALHVCARRLACTNSNTGSSSASAATRAFVGQSVAVLVVERSHVDACESLRQAGLAGSSSPHLAEHMGKEAGRLLGAAGLSDVVDAAVILLSQDGDEIVTSDHDDLERLASASGRHIALRFQTPPERWAAQLGLDHRSGVLRIASDPDN